MKYKFTGLIIFLVILFVSIRCSKNESEIKDKIVNHGEQEYNYSWGYYKVFDDIFLEEIHNMPIEILGWSKKGLLAYRYRKIEKQYTFEIVNTVTNEIIETDYVIMGENNVGINEGSSTRLYYFDENGDFCTPEWKTLTELNKLYKKKWNTLMKKNRIIGKVKDPFSDNFQDDLLEFPVYNYSCWFEYITNNDIDYFNYKDFLEDNEEDIDVFKWELIIGNDSVKRIIGEGKENQYPFPYITGRKIRGYFNSPYENRMVIIVNYYIFHPPHYYFNTALNIFGCNINDIEFSE